MITRIIIEHFKSIEHCDLTLGPVNIFVGPNGSGKSNIIDAISFIKDAVENDLDHAFRERLGIGSTRQWSPSRPYHIKISLHLRSERGAGRYSVSIGPKKSGFCVVNEEAAWSGSLNKDLNFKFSFHRKKGEKGESRSQLFDKNRSSHIEPEKEIVEIPDTDVFIKKSETFSLNRVGSRFLADAVLNFERYSVFPNTLRLPQSSSTERRLNREGNNLNVIIKNMGKTKSGARAKEKIVTSLRSLMPSLSSLNVVELGGFLVPSFKVSEAPKGQGSPRSHEFNVSQVSDGTLRALGLLTALYHVDRPRAIAIEEPEQTVHPGVLSVLAEAIRESSLESQVLVTTHSPDLLDHFDPESVFAVEMVDGVTKVAGVSEGQMASVREGLFTLGEIMSMEGVMRASPPPPDTATGTDDA